MIERILGTNKPVQENDIDANYEGNDAMLLFSRLRNPIIRRQLINLYIKARGGGLAEGEEEIERQLDLRLGKEEQKTAINYTNEEPHADYKGAVISLGWCNPLTGKKPSSKHLSIIEAHEKGHSIRFTAGYLLPYLSAYFSQALDMKGVVLSEDLRRLLKEWAIEDSKTEDEVMKEYLKYLLYPEEIAERMSQLKNYFGISGSEKLTQAQLDYAKKHYVDNTGFDNGMSIFFQAITPEKEMIFLEIINNSGI